MGDKFTLPGFCPLAGFRLPGGPVARRSRNRAAPSWGSGSGPASLLRSQGRHPDLPRPYGPEPVDKRKTRSRDRHPLLAVSTYGEGGQPTGSGPVGRVVRTQNLGGAHAMPTLTIDEIDTLLTAEQGFPRSVGSLAEINRLLDLRLLAGTEEASHG